LYFIKQIWFEKFLLALFACYYIMCDK